MTKGDFRLLHLPLILAAAFVILMASIAVYFYFNESIILYEPDECVESCEQDVDWEEIDKLIDKAGSGG